jgi:hypothetical protein
MQGILQINVVFIFQVGYAVGVDIPTRKKLGRPRKPAMPCGWGCGAKLLASQVVAHYQKCPNHPDRGLPLAAIREFDTSGSVMLPKNEQYPKPNDEEL